MKVLPAKPYSRTGLRGPSCINKRGGMIGCGVGNFYPLMASEPWACVGRAELHKSEAGGRHLIKQAFLSYKEIPELS